MVSNSHHSNSNFECIHKDQIALAPKFKIFKELYRFN